MRYKIKHPMADTMSVIDHSLAYSGKKSSELAFFHRGEWIVRPIPEFAQYHDGTPEDHDTAVYPWVPNELIKSFLEKYSA